MGNNGWDPYGNLGGQMSSGISFTEQELTNRGTDIDRQTTNLEQLKQVSGHLPVPWPHFGVIGLGVHNAHGNAIESRDAALARAKAALESWKTGLQQADANYQKANAESGAIPPPDDIGGPGDIGGLGGLNKPNVPGVTNAGLPTIPDGKLPDGTLPDGKLPDGTLPDGNLPGNNLPGTDNPSTNLPNANLPNAGLPQQNLPNTGSVDMKVPDIDSALNKPGKTDLSSFQPPTTPGIGSNLPSIDHTSPGLGTRTGPGTFGGPGSGMGVGVGPNGAVPGAGAGLRGAGGAGMPMMPMMPMGGAGAGGDQQRDREKTVGLSEDEGVWGGDEDIAPQVIGQEEGI